MVMAVCMGIICMSGCDSKDISGAQEEKINVTEKGNDESNMRFGSNGGLITAGDGKIYYIMVSDKDYRKGDLMVMNEDGTQEEKICSFSNNERCLNYMDGYLYYVMADGDYDSVVKMKADGSEKTVLFKEKPEEQKLLEYNSYSITQLVVLKNKIITKLTVSLSDDAYWYVFDCESQTNTMINNEVLDLNDGIDGVGFNLDIRNMIFEDEWLYYKKNYYNDDGRIERTEIRKTRYDGTEDTILLEGNRLSLKGKIDNNIIYSEPDYTIDNENELKTTSVKYKIYDMDNQCEQIFYEEKNDVDANREMTSMNIWRDKLYYVLTNTENNTLESIHQVNILKKEDTLVYEFDENCKIFTDPTIDRELGLAYQFVDGWLYTEGYGDANFENQVTYKIKLDGSVVEKVEPVV